MTRRMADSINASSCPAGYDLYGGYDDGRYQSAPGLKALYPARTVVRFTVFASDNEGDCLDVENGDATPAQAPGWVAMRRAAGHGGPLVYCNASTWQTVIDAFIAAGVAQPGYIIAAYPGAGATIPAGAVGHQWIDYGSYDESVIVDYLPGIDAVPPPPPPPPPPPNPIGPTVPVGDDVQQTTLTIPTDANGCGWILTSLPWPALALVHQGSDPGTDNGYWTGDAHAQERNGGILVSVTGCRPLGEQLVFVTHN